MADPCAVAVEPVDILEAEPEPAARLHVLLDADSPTLPSVLTECFIEQCCLAALQHQQLLTLDTVSDIELSIQFLAPAAMADLNAQYRQKQTPTNVLSFASGMPVMAADRGPDSGQAGGSLLLLGDLVLCPTVVAGEAAEQGKSEKYHFAHLLVHGTLHLCGHDHECIEAAQAMEAMEIQILSGLGIADPYSVTSPSEWRSE